MSSMVVRFVDVGRGKATWVQEFPGENPLEEILTAIFRKKRNGAPVLMSQGIEVVMNEAGTGGAILVGGFRQVGSFELLEPV